MRCKTCDYRLWNLRTRACPECGRAFRPSEFEFAPDSVKFCCPHCAQDYYGTARNGHLVPRAFACVKCGQHVDMDQMVLLPAAGLREDHTQGEVLPWTAPGKSRLTAWVETIMMALFQPRRLARTLPLEGGTFAAAKFATITLSLQVLVGIVTIGLIVGLVFLAGIGGAPTGGSGLGVPRVLLATGSIFVSLLLVFLVAFAGLWVWALLIHGTLLVTGGCAGGLGRTARVVFYASAPCVIGAIPCLGPYIYFIGIIWWVVCMAIMLRVVHDVSGWRASIAAILVPTLCFAAAVSFFVYTATVAIPGSITRARAIQAQASTSDATNKTKALAGALTLYRQRLGKEPEHAVQLVTAQFAFASDFALMGSNPAPGSGAVSGIALTDMRSLGQEPVESLLQRVTAALPPSGEHRIGDFVFCHRGAMDVTGPDANELWIIICCEPANAAPPPTPTPNSPFLPPPVRPLSAGVWMVGKLDGSVEQIDAVDTPAKLAEQNALRAQHGLPPLSDPTSVLQRTTLEDPRGSDNPAQQPAEKPSPTPPAGG